MKGAGYEYRQPRVSDNKVLRKSEYGTVVMRRDKRLFLLSLPDLLAPCVLLAAMVYPLSCSMIGKLGKTTGFVLALKRR